MGKIYDIIEYFATIINPSRTVHPHACEGYLWTACMADHSFYVSRHADYIAIRGHREQHLSKAKSGYDTAPLSDELGLFVLADF
jgi:hypothetical protein